MLQASDKSVAPHQRHHGFGRRNGEELATGALVKAGKFGRMFGKLDPLRVTDEQLTALGAAMFKASPDENPGVPAGFTYFGQFIDHDITLDTTGLGEVVSDPGAVQNFRTPMLDLDCLYGSGPVAHPFLYRREDPDLFLIGHTNVTPGKRDPKVKASLPFDLPRAPHGLALIGDPRNDENLVVAQLHLALLKFHNKIVAMLRADGPPKLSIFEDARQLVQWHYQWVVLHDFLGRILNAAVLKDVVDNGRKFYRFEEQSEFGEPYMPAEFSVAAYRLGHSMVRDLYDYNSIFNPVHTPGTATLEQLFIFSGLSHSIPSPAGFPFVDSIPIPSDWIIDWRRFFELGGQNLNHSLKLDPFLATTLSNLPGVPQPNSLATRNLLRSKKMGLPSGQDVARAMNLEPLSETQITSGPDGAVLRAQELHEKTPLWYYILKEAEAQEGGLCLGQVGSRIVAEVFVGMLEGDPASYLSRDKNWKPTLGKGGSFTMADLLSFVGDLSPVDDPANRDA